MTYTGRNRLADFVRGIGALVVFVFLLAGFPVAMYAMGGSPIPDRIPSWEEVSTTLMQPDTDHTLFLSTIRLIGWGAWCLFIIIVCTEMMNYLVGRSRAATLPRPVRPLQQLIRDMVATATLAFSVAASLATSATAATHAHATTGVHAAAGPESGTQEQRSPRQTAPPQEPTTSDWTPLLADEPPSDPKTEDRSWQTHVVEPGETLWGLASRSYGSGTQYPEIFENSRAIDQPDGVPALTDPDMLHPGQRIRLPRPDTPQDTPSPSRTASPRADTEPGPPGPGKANDPPTPGPRGSTPDRSTASPVRSPIVAPPADHSASPPPPATLDTEEAGSPLAVSLPSGSRIGLGLAAALSVAVAATRLHRRRRRPLANDPDAASKNAPEPPVAAPALKARKAHLDAYTDRETPTPSDPELLREDLNAAEPDHLVVGTREGHAVTIPLSGLSLGLSGDGSHAAARAITTEVLAKAHRYRAEILIPQADAHALFPGDDITDLSTALEGLIIEPSLDEATNRLETELFRRGRILETTEQPDVPALRADDPAEPLPTVLLVASVPADDGTVHALAALGRRYGIGVLALGAWPTGTQVELSSDATVTGAHGPNAERFARAHLFHLTTDDAAGMLQTIRTATGTEAAAAPPPPSADTAPEPEPQAVSTVVPPPRPSEGAQRPPVRLNVLGHVDLHTAEGPITTGLRQRARDLLVYLALHPDGVTRERASADLWPDEDPESVIPRFNTAVGNIRSVLRTATGLSEPMYVIHSTGRYRIDPDFVGIDLWDLTGALADAQRAPDDHTRAKALTLVADGCTDEFAEGLTQEWAETQRERLRRTVGDALANLARLIQEDDPEEALTVLEHAITQDPYSEALYRQVMRLQARLDRPDAVRRTYQLLSARLDELDAEPDDETRKLANSPTGTSNRN